MTTIRSKQSVVWPGKSGIEKVNSEVNDIQLEGFMLSPEDKELLARDLLKSERDAIWKRLAEEMQFYPGTVEIDNEDWDFMARPVNRYTSLQDIEEGWSLNDWTSGWGPGEKWRFQLSRRLTKTETARFTVHADTGETWNQEIDGYDLDLTLKLMRRICEDDMTVLKVRKDRIDAVSIKDGWEPVWPEPADIEIVLDSSVSAE